MHVGGVFVLNNSHTRAEYAEEEEEEEEIQRRSSAYFNHLIQTRRVYGGGDSMSVGKACSPCREGLEHFHGVQPAGAQPVLARHLLQ